jgi:hypothetical protein
VTWYVLGFTVLITPPFEATNILSSGCNKFK